MHLSTSGSECGNQRDFLCPSCLNFLIKTDCWVYNYFMSVIDVTVYRKCFRLLSRLQPCQIYLHITSLPPAVDDTNPNVLGTFEFPAYAVFIPFYRHQLERFILLCKTCSRLLREALFTPIHGAGYTIAIILSYALLFVIQLVTLILIYWF